MVTRNPYDVLGVPSNANQSEIRSAYQADKSEYERIDLQLIKIGNKFTAVQKNIFERLQCMAIQLTARYGTAFQA